jgi:hypothetical protein
LGMMKLRRHVFELLDRNLVLGESMVSLVCSRAQCWNTRFVATPPVEVGLVRALIMSETPKAPLGILAAPPTVCGGKGNVGYIRSTHCS